MFRPASIVPAFLLIGLTTSLLFATFSVSTYAQSNPTSTPSVDDWYLDNNAAWNSPYPQPGTSVGNAIWSVESEAFTSSYPDGFTFTIRVQSNAAPVTVASVIWSHTPNELKRQETQDIDGNGLIQIRYRTSRAIPPWVAVNYYWSFIDANGNRYRTDWIVGSEYVPDDPDQWIRYESEDIIVVIQNTLSQDAISNTVDAMTQQRNTFLQAWGELLPYKPRAILFSDRQDFNAWLGNFDTSILGLTDPEWGTTVQVFNPEDTLADLTYGTVPHEIAHLYQFEFVGERGFPSGSWFTEGNATLFELSQMYDYEDRIRTVALEGNLPPLFQNDNLFAMSFGPDQRSRYGYDLGYTFWKWLIVEYGLDGHRQLIERLADGVERNDALESITGLRLSEIETAWAQWLGAEAAAPPILVPSNIEHQFPPTMTPFPVPR